MINARAASKLEYSDVQTSSSFKMRSNGSDLPPISARLILRRPALLIRCPTLEFDFITCFVTTTPKSADYWSLPKWETTLRTNERILEHYGTTPSILGRFSVTPRRRGNRINRIYEAGDVMIPGGAETVGISFWDQKENAEAYNREIYPEVQKLLAKVIEGTPQVQTYEVSRSTFHKIAARATA